MSTHARNRESGYALLFIFLTAAIVGITLYAAMPRVAFEAQRDQEELLIDRGEQYKRAIQLYYKKFKRYPAKMEDLENSNGQRFLRQRYVDPMTGKSEWRAIHVGPGGVLTDSLTQKNNQKKQDPASVNNFITELKPMGDGGDPANAGANIGLRRRPSDQSAAEGADQAFSAGSTDPNNAGSIPGGFAGGVPGNFQNNTGFQANGSSGNGVIYANGNQNIANGQIVDPINGAPGVVQQQPGNGADMIRNLLTSPRPGGPPPGVFGGGQVNDVGFVNGSKTGPSWNNGNTSGADGSIANNSSSVFANNSGSTPTGANALPQTRNVQNVFASGATGGGGMGGSSLGTSATGSSAPGQQIGGGIAGFASKAERPGIKIYKDHQKYNEWEFIYDFAKDATMGGGQQLPTNAANNGNNGTGANAQNGGTGATQNNPAVNSTNSGTNSGQMGTQPGTTTAPNSTAFPVIPPSNP